MVKQKCYAADFMTCLQLAMTSWLSANTQFAYFTFYLCGWQNGEYNGPSSTTIFKFQVKNFISEMKE